MKKIITVILTVCMAVCLIAAPASAAGIKISRFDWQSIYDWFCHPPVASEEAESPAESTEPEEPEEPEETQPAEEYTIRYDANGGIWWSLNSSPATSNIKYVYVQAGDSTKTLSAPTRGGYAFRGWQAEDGTVYGVKEAFVPECNMNLKALWECTVD